MGRRKKKHSPKVGGIKPNKPTKVKPAVDAVTGKATIEYFFDPALLQTKTTSSATGTPFKGSKGASEEKSIMAKYLFVPCTIIKPIGDDENESNSTANLGQPYAGPTLVKTADGTLHKEEALTPQRFIINLQNSDA